MRTTLTLDDDLIRRVREEAARTRRTVREVLNQRLRLGLAVARLTKPFRVEPFTAKGFAPGVDELKLNQLADTLEAEHTGR
jgi:hypothetical protein